MLNIAFMNTNGGEGFGLYISTPCCCLLIVIGVVVWLVMRSRKQE